MCCSRATRRAAPAAPSNKKLDANDRSALATDAEIVTIVEGEGAPIAIDEVTGLVADGVESEAHRGGQPHYWWLLASQ